MCKVTSIKPNPICDPHQVDSSVIKIDTNDNCYINGEFVGKVIAYTQNTFRVRWASKNKYLNGIVKEYHF